MMADLIFWCEKCNRRVTEATMLPNNTDSMEFVLKCHDQEEKHLITGYEILSQFTPIFTYCFKQPNAIDIRDDNQTKEPIPQGV